MSVDVGAVLLIIGQPERGVSAEENEKQFRSPMANARGKGFSGRVHPLTFNAVPLCATSQIAFHPKSLHQLLPNFHLEVGLQPT